MPRNAGDRSSTLPVQVVMIDFLILKDTKGSDDCLLKIAFIIDFFVCVFLAYGCFRATE